MKGIFSALILVFACSAHGRLSPEWIDAPAVFPNERLLIHSSSSKAQASSLAVQRPSENDARVVALFDELKKTGPAVEDLLPHKCFILRREGLKSHQTWCRSTSGSYLIFVELGPARMKPVEILQVELAALQQSKQPSNTEENK